MNKSKWRFGRVDFQVSIFTALMVLASALSVFYICYHITYRDMIRSLSDRVMAIYNHLETSLDPNTFINIDGREDMQKMSYINTKELLEQIRNTTDVRYLYTAKVTADDRLIYVVDGLDYSAPDFRYPGDLIEIEIQNDLRIALSGKIIMPDTIKTTEWGKIFITYLPIHVNEEIVGVVGIEFDAEHQYNTYRYLRIFTPIIAIIFCLCSVMISAYAFRRISNPNYRDMSNTDKETQLKNRNAFDVDLSNLMAKNKLDGIGMIVFDLNHLKAVNDALGHSVGDLYIKIVADELMASHRDCDVIFYRIGGDEFAGVVQNADENAIKKFIQRVNAGVEQHKDLIGMDISVSAGYAIFDAKADKDLLCTYERADIAMYEDKKEHRLKG